MLHRRCRLGVTAEDVREEYVETTRSGVSFSVKGVSPPIWLCRFGIPIHVGGFGARLSFRLDVDYPWPGTVHGLSQQQPPSLFSFYCARYPPTTWRFTRTPTTRYPHTPNRPQDTHISFTLDSTPSLHDHSSHSSIFLKYLPAASAASPTLSFPLTVNRRHLNIKTFPPLPEPFHNLPCVTASEPRAA